MSDPSKAKLIHTSCRSESSNISLVVLDKDEKFPLLNELELPERVLFLDTKKFHYIHIIMQVFDSFLAYPC